MSGEELWRERQRALLEDVRDICHMHGIDMFLFGETALTAVRDGRIDDFPCVCIDAADALGFIAAIESERGESLYVESMRNNPRYLDFSIRVVDPNTIDFDMFSSRKYSCNGLHVTVELIAHKSKTKLGQVRTRVLDSIGRISKKLAYAKNASGACATASFSRSQLAASRRLFKSLVSAASGCSPTVSVGDAEFPAELFSTSHGVSVGDCEYRIPGEGDAFLVASFGRGYRKHKVLPYEETPFRFRDVRHSWKSYVQRISYLDLKDFEETRSRYWSLHDSWMEQDVYVQRCYRLLHRTHWRFALWQQFMPKKSEILDAWQRGDVAKLERELKPYFDRLEECRRDGLGLCFDQEIFDVAMAVLENAGRKDYADELRSLVPEVHKRPIQLKAPTKVEPW